MVEPLAYTIEDAALACDVSKDTIRRAIKSGALRAKRTSRHADGRATGRTLIFPYELRAWLEALPDDDWGPRY